MLLISSFFLSLRRAYLKENEWILKENEWKWLDPQRYCFIKNSIFKSIFSINVFLSISHAMIYLKVLYSQYEQMSMSLHLGWEQD